MPGFQCAYCRANILDQHARNWTSIKKVLVEAPSYPWVFRPPGKKFDPTPVFKDVIVSEVVCDGCFIELQYDEIHIDRFRQSFIFTIVIITICAALATIAIPAAREFLVEFAGGFP